MLRIVVPVVAVLLTAYVAVRYYLSRFRHPLGNKA